MGSLSFSTGFYIVFFLVPAIPIVLVSSILMIGSYTDRRIPAGFAFAFCIAIISTLVYVFKYNTNESILYLIPLFFIGLSISMFGVFVNRDKSTSGRVFGLILANLAGILSIASLFALAL